MIVETLTTENVFELQRKLDKELATRRFVVSFKTSFTPTSGGQSPALGHICEDRPVSLLKFLELFYRAQSIKELHQAGIYVNNLSLATTLKEKRYGQECWDGKQSLFFYRLNNPGHHWIPDLEPIEPTHLLKAEHYWVSRIDCIPVVKERERLRRKRKNNEC